MYINIVDAEGRLTDRFSLKETSIVESWHHVVNRLKLSLKTASEVGALVDLQN